MPSKHDKVVSFCEVGGLAAARPAPASARPSVLRLHPFRFVLEGWQQQQQQQRDLVSLTHVQLMHTTFQEFPLRQPQTLLLTTLSDTTFGTLPLPYFRLAGLISERHAGPRHRALVLFLAGRNKLFAYSFWAAEWNWNIRGPEG